MAELVQTLWLQTGRLRVRFPMETLEIFMDIIFRPHYGPGVDSASNRNEYQEYCQRGKGGRCVGLTTLPPSCADCLEIWEPQGLSRPVMGLLYLYIMTSASANHRQTDNMAAT